MGDFSGDPTVTYAGWTYKEGSLVKNWKKRFLVVKRRELAYYKTTDHTSRHAQLMGGMRIARAEITDGITNGLRITSVEGRELKIFMDTAAERDRCYNAIVEWCHPGGASAGATATAPPTTTRPARKSAPQQPQQPPTRMTGWLEKQGQNMPTWKRRFFVLEDGILSYSTQEGKASLARHRVLGVRRDRTKPFTLELRLDTGRDLRVSASNEHDLNDWHRAIQATIQSAAHRDRGSSHPPSQHDGRTASERSIARPMLSEPQDSFNLFGAPPAAPNDAATDEDERRNANMSFGHSIRLDFDGENTSFIEVEAPPAVKPWSPTAPGPETIRKMRIEQNLLLDSDDEDDFEISTVASSTSKNTGSSSPVPSRRPQDRTNRKRKHEQAAGPGACCCIVM